MRKSKPLTKTMIELVEYMRDATLYRHPGGFWTRQSNWDIYARSYGTPSVQALVLRGIAEYTEWKDGKANRFPVQARLVQS